VTVIAYKWQSLLAAGCRSASLIRDLVNLIMVGLRHTQEHLLLLGRKNALERVAAFLLDMSERTKAGSVVELAMPRHDIADYLGLTLETVSRMFAELKEQGTIRLEGARRVHLLDTERLAAMGA
jgi:CRP/FNR family nitrogen fixation transcriptional regulator